MVIQKYYVVSLGEGKYASYFTVDEKLSDWWDAAKYATRKEALEQRDWLKETFVGKVEVAELNIVVHIENT